MTHHPRTRTTAIRNNYGKATESQISDVISTSLRYGASSIVALAGVPGTGKSFVGRIAAQRIAGLPERVLEVQFHPSSSYEEFVEGMRIANDGSFYAARGAFLEWNDLALSNPDQTWVVLIDEFSRADVSAVLGEVLTFVEDRGRTFVPTYSRRPTTIAANLRIIVTFNPTDRSALEIDNALLRRLRIVDFPPDESQLDDMLGDRIPINVLDRLKGLFSSVRSNSPDQFDHQMPFGHGIFAEVDQETPDLYDLWKSRIHHMLRRPLVAPHPFTDLIESAYPWRTPEYVEPTHRGPDYFAADSGNSRSVSTSTDSDNWSGKAPTRNDSAESTGTNLFNSESAGGTGSARERSE